MRAPALSRPLRTALLLAGLAALALGVTAFCVVALTQDKFWATPNWHLTVPFFVVTTGVAVVSFVRKEHAVALPLLGVGLAAAAVVLGWFLITAIIVGATALIILILSHAM